MREEYNTDHLKAHTLKLFMDGTLKLHTGAMVTPYADTGELGVTALSADEIADVVKRLNAEGLDFHTHCVGERSSRVVLDGVEKAKRELGDDFRAHHLYPPADPGYGRLGSLRRERRLRQLHALVAL